MKKAILLFSLLGISSVSLMAQSPIITSWKLNTTGYKITKGSLSILADVEAVYYDSSFVYIKTSGVPSYYNFTTTTNINQASDLKDIFKITRTPQQNTGIPFSTLGGGQYGLAKDGTLIFNGEDARSYQNQQVWHQLAYYFESNDFDNTWGHSTPTNEYHHHVLDLALQDTTKSMIHSPILGYAFDGYPIYGPFAYKDPNDPKSKIVRVTTSYRKRNMTTRTTLPDGTAATQPGPVPGGQYPLGCYREDYIYVAGSGMLDDHNGRFAVTPEYPNGTYAYYAILDSQLKPQYPYTFGQTLYGVPTQGNFGPTGGKNTVPANAVTYGKTGMEPMGIWTGSLSLYPNPSSTVVHLQLPATGSGWLLEVTDMAGRTLLSRRQAGIDAIMDITRLQPGIYIVKATGAPAGKVYVGQMVRIER